MRSWIKPQLVELARGRPEEAILQACKDGTLNNANFDQTPSSVHAHCVVMNDVGPGLDSTTCVQCQSLPSS